MFKASYVDKSSDRNHSMNHVRKQGKWPDNRLRKPRDYSFEVYPLSLDIYNSGMRYIKHLASTLLFTIFASSCLWAQPFIDVLNIRMQRFREVPYVEKQNTKVRTSEITGNLNLPIQLKNKDIILTGGTYDHFIFRNSDGRIENLYALNGQLGYLKTWKGDKWKTLIMVLPKLSANQLRFRHDSYQAGGVILLTFKKKENLTYKIGLYYNREFFGNFFVPLFGLDWKPLEKLNIYGVLPGNMNAEYRLNKKFYIGASYNDYTVSYRIQNTGTYVRNGSPFWGHNQLRAFINFYSTKNLVLFGEVGYTFLRNFQAYKGKNEKVNDPFFMQNGDGPLINAGLAYRVRLN